MSFYEDHILPRCVELTLSTRPVRRARERVVAALSGEVLEIGFGSGLNVPYYPSAVTKVHAVDPSALGQKLAAKRLAASPVAVEWSGLDGEKLQLPDASVDAVLSTFTLCTIPDVGRALAELRRVLRPAGTLHFLEHGRSPDASIAKWQDRLTPVQKFFAGGCHLNRDVSVILRAAGFSIDALSNYYMRGPKVGTYLYEGRAHVEASSSGQ